MCPSLSSHFCRLLCRDWYNLEKSKRVKAFRCGEFDACIERAEAAQGAPIKKREKYARREDAILHALELERKQLEQKHQKQGATSNGGANKPSGAFRKELYNSSSSEMYLKNEEPGIHAKISGYKSQMLPKKAAWSQEDEYKSRSNKQFRWEEDTTETIPRMRGLQDFGLRIAPKRKLSPSVAWEMSQNHAYDHVDDFLHTGGEKNALVAKKKRSQNSAFEESSVKKRDRRRPLVQVLQSSSKLPAHHSLHVDRDGSAVSVQGEREMGSAICRAKRSHCIYLPADSQDFMDNDGFPSDLLPTAGDDFGLESCFEYPGVAEDYTSSGLKNESDSLGRECSETDTDEERELFIGIGLEIIFPPMLSGFFSASRCLILYCIFFYTSFPIYLDPISSASLSIWRLRLLVFPFASLQVTTLHVLWTSYFMY